ncbi:hypothetical protein ACQ4PT_040477 [Festuca glaucescens]
MNDSSWKVDTGHKSGYLTYIEKEMAKVLPHADLKADPHIKSKVKILKKQLSYVLEIMQNGSGFGWDDEMKMVVGDRDTYMGWAKSREGAGPLYMKPMVNFDKLCEVYASDLSQGISAKGPGEHEVAQDESPVDAEPTSEPNEKNAAQARDNTNPSGSSRQGRKRTYADDEAAELGLNLEDLTDEEVVMAVRVIGRDAGQTELFLKMRDKYQVVFVRQELEAAKK